MRVNTYKKGSIIKLRMDAAFRILFAAIFANIPKADAYDVPSSIFKNEGSQFYKKLAQR